MDKPQKLKRGGWCGWPHDENDKQLSQEAIAALPEDWQEHEYERINGDKCCYDTGGRQI